MVKAIWHGPCLTSRPCDYWYSRGRNGILCGLCSSIQCAKGVESEMCRLWASTRFGRKVNAMYVKRARTVADVFKTSLGIRITTETLFHIVRMIAG